MKKIISDTFTLFLLLVSFVGLSVLLRTNYIWGDVTLPQIITNLQGGGISFVSDELKNSYILCALIGGVLALVSFVFFNKNRYPFIISLLILLFIFFRTGTFSYVLNKHIYSDLYEKEYTNPKNTEFTFENGKRNLIVIYLESMEKNYTSVGQNKQNFIPNISEYMSSSLSFNNFYPLHTQNYTLAAMISSMCAVSFNDRVYTKGHFGYKNFLNDLICYPEILKRNGYTTVFIKGADADFARSGLFFERHGFQTVLGKDQLLELGYNFQGNEGTFDGFNDHMLYQIAKEKLTELSLSKEPFMFSFLTLDTHHPDPFLEPFCEKKTGNFGDIIICADQMLNDFLQWLQTQDFYAHTTVVVIGDHIKPGAQELQINDKKPQIVNFILNPAISNAVQEHKSWTALDLAPTILNAMGITFPDGHFGLGRSLFFKHPTLIEKFDKKLETELQKNSKVYESFEKLTVKDLPLFLPWTHRNEKLTDAQTIASYATFSNLVLGTPFLDELSFTIPDFIPNGVKISIRFQKVYALLTPPIINVYANNQLIEQWKILSNTPQPITKTITLSKDQIEKGNRILLQFQDEKEVPTREIFGIGVKELQIEVF